MAVVETWHVLPAFIPLFHAFLAPIHQWHPAKIRYLARRVLWAGSAKCMHSTRLHADNQTCTLILVIEMCHPGKCLHQACIELQERCVTCTGSIRVCSPAIWERVDESRRVSSQRLLTSCTCKHFIARVAFVNASAITCKSRQQLGDRVDVTSRSTTSLDHLNQLCLLVLSFLVVIIPLAQLTYHPQYLPSIIISTQTAAVQMPGTTNWDSSETWERVVAAILATGVKVCH